MSRWTRSLRKPPLVRLAGKVSRRFRPFRRHSRPGDIPGAIRADPAAPKPVVTVIAYGPGADLYYEGPADDLDALPNYLARYPVTWVNVDGLGDASVVERLGRLFDLHPLALEDVVHVHQRSKVEDYDDRLFVVARMAEWENDGRPVEIPPGTCRISHAPLPASDDAPATGRRVESEQVSLFLGPNFVLTFQERPGRDSLDPVRSRVRRRRGRIRELGADYLAYSLLDAIVDGYFPIIEELGGRLEDLDSAVLARSGRDHLERLHRLRGDLLGLRKNLWPQREAIHSLIREPHPLVTEETQLFLRDCYDHTVQLLDVVETYRELCADLREYHYAQVSTRTNDVMKVLTIISTIFMPLSFIAGVYGMNFDVSKPGNLPELRQPYAYPVTLAAMAAIAAGFFVWFKKLGWLRRDE